MLEFEQSTEKVTRHNVHYRAKATECLPFSEAFTSFLADRKMPNDVYIE